MTAMSKQADSRSSSFLSTPARMALILATCLVAVAAYFYLTPTSFMGKDGGIFGCGSPMQPNADDLGKGQCSIVEKTAAHRAYLFLALAAITAGLGMALLGNSGAGHRRGRVELEPEPQHATAEPAPEHSSDVSGAAPTDAATGVAKPTPQREVSTDVPAGGSSATRGERRRMRRSESRFRSDEGR